MRKKAENMNMDITKRNCKLSAIINTTRTKGIGVCVCVCVKMSKRVLEKCAVWTATVIAVDNMDLITLLLLPLSCEIRTLEDEDVKKEYQRLVSIMTCILCMKRYRTCVWNKVPRDVIHLIIRRAENDMRPEHY